MITDRFSCFPRTSFSEERSAELYDKAGPRALPAALSARQQQQHLLRARGGLGGNAEMELLFFPVVSFSRCGVRGP